MLSDLERLIKLQHLDSRIAEARAGVAAHPQRVADAEGRLKEATDAVESAKQRLKDSQEARRTLEKDAALYQSRLSKFKEQLSAIKTNREYQAMQHEIETAQADLGRAEEKVLERMMEADQIAGEIKQLDAALAARRTEIDAEKTVLAEDLAFTTKSLNDASASRAALVKDLDARALALFENVARARKGIAVAAATRDGLCSVCHVRLRPPVFQQVRQNDTIVQCESCQRILYYVPPPPPIEQAIVRT